MILWLAVAVWCGALGWAWVARRRGGADYRADVAAAGVIGVATAGFFWRLLFSSNVWMPAGGGDLAGFLYPAYAFAAEWLRRGVIPLWNPYLYTGMPFIGDIQAGLFYPVNLLAFFLSNPLTFRDLELLSVLHFFIAGSGMYALLRFGRWGESPVASLQSPVVGLQSPVASLQSPVVTRHLPLKDAGQASPVTRVACLAGALAFEFSDLFITHFGNLNLIAVAAWLPWVFLFFHRAVTSELDTDQHRLHRFKKPLTFVIISGVLLGVAFLAGHAQAFLFIALTLVVYVVYYELRIGNCELRITNYESRIYVLLSLALVFLIAFAIGAVVLLPSVEMTQFTARAEFPYEQAARFSLPPAELIGMLVPGFFGRGPQAAWGPWDRVEVGYLGVLPLMLAVLAVILRRDSLTRFFAVLALLGLALALGGYAISHGWFYQFAPGFGQLRAPARFVFVMDFALAVLAAFGFDALVREGGALCLTPLRAITRALPWVFLIVAVGAGGTALAILILGQNQDPTIFARIANAVNALAFFLLLFGLSVALLVARATRFFRPRAWSLAALVLIFFDLFSLGAYVDIGTDDPTAAFRHPDLVQFLRSDGTFYRIDARTDIDAAWLPDTAILYSLYDAGGLFNPLQLADTDRYWESLGSRSTPLYDLLNIKYLLARKNTPLDLDKFKLAYEGDLNVYENTRVLPRVFMVYTTRVVADHAAAFAAIHAADFDPRQMLVVENGRALAGQAVGEARIVGYGPNEIVLEANSPREGYLFLSEVYYPGWRALVDEHEEQIVRADYLFRAVYVPAGAHRVRVMFDPWTFRAGAIISGALVVLLAAWGIRMMKK